MVHTEPLRFGSCNAKCTPQPPRFGSCNVKCTQTPLRFGSCNAKCTPQPPRFGSCNVKCTQTPLRFGSCNAKCTPQPPRFGSCNVKCTPKPLRFGSCNGLQEPKRRGFGCKIRNGEISVCTLFGMCKEFRETDIRNTLTMPEGKGRRKTQRIEEAHTHDTALTNCQAILINKFLYLSVISSLFTLIVSQSS